MTFKNFSQAINVKVKVQTSLDQSITGYVYSFSASNEVLSLRIPHTNQSNNKKRTDSYRIINTAFIKSIQVLQPHLKKGPNVKVPLTSGELEKSLNEAIGKIRST